MSTTVIPLCEKGKTCPPQESGLWAGGPRLPLTHIDPHLFLVLRTVKYLFLVMWPIYPF